jgi:hypothetical protein
MCCTKAIQEEATIYPATHPAKKRHIDDEIPKRRKNLTPKWFSKAQRNT